MGLIGVIYGLYAGRFDNNFHVVFPLYPTALPMKDKGLLSIRSANLPEYRGYKSTY